MSTSPSSSPQDAARIRAILDTTVDAIVTIDAAGIILEFNRAAVAMFGYAVDEAVGQNVSILMPEPDRQHHDGYMQRYLQTGQARIIGIGRQVTGLRKDGTSFPLHLAVSEVNLNGNRTFTGILRDLSEQQRMEAAIASVGDRVRRDVGGELHDVLGQQMTGASLLAKTLQKQLESSHPELAELAENIHQLAREGMGTVRRLAQGLYPTALQHHGLSAALQELVDTQQRISGRTCTFSTDGVELELPHDTQLNLYRIAQEALTNALKHSQAEAIEVELTRTGDGSRLAVSDDGVGLPIELGGLTGMGLLIMRHRASMMGARLSYQRREEGGTQVVCQLPVETKKTDT